MGNSEETLHWQTFNSWLRLYLTIRMERFAYYSSVKLVPGWLLSDLRFNLMWNVLINNRSGPRSTPMTKTLAWGSDKLKHALVQPQDTKPLSLGFIKWAQGQQEEEDEEEEEEEEDELISFCMIKSQAEDCRPFRQLRWNLDSCVCPCHVNDFVPHDRNKKNHTRVRKDERERKRKRKGHRWPQRTDVFVFFPKTHFGIFSPWCSGRVFFFPLNLSAALCSRTRTNCVLK